MSQELTERVRALPEKPGIYIMKDRDGEVLYVGKAKDLKARVQSYFRGGDGRASIPFLIRQLVTIETVVTEDERQALVLESDLIKKFRPRYNIRLKDDKAHFLVRIDLEQEWPRIDLVRQVFDDGARYFGPYAFAHELRAMLEAIRATTPLRTCSDRVLYNRVRPCLEYQIKRCLGPCCLPVEKSDYDALVEQAIQVLNGKNSEVIRHLEAEMMRASEELRFEEAALLRDRIEVLTKVVEEKPVFTFSAGSKDAFGLHREGARVEVSLLMVRKGRLFGARTFGFSEVEIPNEELLPSLLSQYYANGTEIPEQIVLPFAIEDRGVREEVYSGIKGGAVSIVTPQRGRTMRLLELAEENARENFTARFGTAKGGAEKTMQALADELHLEELPRTIECVDVSHFQGGSTVASVVFFQDGQPNKSRYRHFHLTQEGKPDDFASMREVVMRHLSRCAEENTVCDLMVIDGGKAQLAQALAVRRELGLTRPMMIGLAKKRIIPGRQAYYAKGKRGYKPERVFVEEATTSVVLRDGGQALHLLERIRDEAHRFAVTFHRKTRAKKMFRSPLDQIPGLGPERKKSLLREFGTVAAIRGATPEDLSNRCRIPPALATRIVKVLKLHHAQKQRLLAGDRVTDTNDDEFSQLPPPHDDDET